MFLLFYISYIENRDSLFFGYFGVCKNIFFQFLVFFSTFGAI